MKAYIYDHGWEGAEIYFSESREKAVKYFQDKEIIRAEACIRQHDVKRSGPVPASFLYDLEQAKSDLFGLGIEECACKEGNFFFTDGG